jgi:heterodisulfide reductase subunit A
VCFSPASYGDTMLTFKVGTLAHLLDVHRNTVTNWIRNGKLSAKPVQGRQYRMSRKAFSLFCRDEGIPDSIRQKAFDLFDARTAVVSTAKGTQKRYKGRVGAVMVVGGGIAGIQAAMELADAGFYVYLVEKSAGIGGTMAQLDKTFPTNDCSSCIILPKLVQCGRHRNIKLMTLSQIGEVSGSVGHFKIQVISKPRFVDEGKCIACGICAQRCPINVPDDFNFNTAKKKAVYIKYDQSVPHKYAIDPSACIYFTLGKCKACEKFCPTGAIDFTQKEKRTVIDVGVVILSIGFKPFDPGIHDHLGYKSVPDVVTSLEFERLLSVSGPNKGTLVRPSDHTQPKKIAWILCIGSRNLNGCGNSYCSNICCMAAVKQSRIAIEHINGRRMDRTVFYMDLRSHGKESERYFEAAKTENVRFVRALPHTVDPGKDGTGVRLRYVDEKGRVQTESFEMAVLSIGLEAPEDAQKLAEKFEISLDRHQFASTTCFKPIQTSRKGIFAVGALQTPKAIPRSVVQASAAAAEASRLLIRKRGTKVRKKGFPKERRFDGKPPVVGVFVCSCGVNIAGTVDVDKVVEYAAQLPHVAYAENNLFSCSVDAQESIIQKIEDFNLNRVVIAACTPRTHEHMFQETLKKARLNGFMVEMANIRNQNSWVHQQDAVSATRKAKDQVRMAVAKVAYNYPLQQERINVVKKVLIVGGGVVGMTSALTLSGLGIESVLIEKSDLLGGNALKLESCFKGDKVAPMLEDLIAKVNKTKRIRVLKQTVLAGVNGSVGNFKGVLLSKEREIPVEFGAAIMASGAREAVPHEYLYGGDDRVMTQMTFDEQVLYRKDRIEKARSIVFIQCVGSREPDRPYCSRVCCVHSVNAAIRIKQKNPSAAVYILYRDMRTYGEWESLYKTARDLGVIFIRYSVGSKPDVRIDAGILRVQIHDPIIDMPVAICADYLVLSSGVVAADNRQLANLFKFSMNRDGFFSGAHPKLKPVDLSVAGLFLAGICNYPKPLDESIEQAKAAAHRVFVLLSQNEIKSEAIKSFMTDTCDGCAMCVDVCPFRALSVQMPDAQKGEIRVRIITDPALCQGCGLCAATCHKDGIMVHGFTKPQLMAQVRAAMNGVAT